MSTNLDPLPDIPPVDPHVIETFDERKMRYYEELKRHAEAGDGDTLIAFMRAKLFEDLKNRDLEAHRLHLRNIDQTCKYLGGEQYGRWDENGEYEPYVRLPNEVTYCLPVIIGHFQQALMMLLKTNLEYQCSAKDRTNPAHVQLASMVEKLGTEDYKRLMDEDARVDEAINALTSGESHRLLLWGIHDNPKLIEKPVYEESGFEIPSSSMCKSCNTVNDGEATECSECGSDWLERRDPVQQTSQQFKGTEQVPIPQNILHIPHMTAVKSDTAANDIRYATFVVETDYLPNKQIAQWLYKCILEDADRQTGEEVRLQREQQGASTTLSPYGPWQDRIDREAATNMNGLPMERNHVWLEPAEYGWKIFAEDQQLPDGTVIKAGIPMGEQMPDGFKFCLVGNTCVTGGAGDKKRQWYKVLYGKRPGSARGLGIQIYIPIQDLTNEALNMDLTILMSSVPFRAIVKQYVDKLPQAGENLYLTKIPPGGIEQAVKSFPAQTPSGMVGAMAQAIQDAGQFILGTQSVIGRTGDPSQKALGTAHGVAAVVEQQNGRFITPTTQRVACDKKLLDGILSNIRDAAKQDDVTGRAIKNQLEQRFGPDAVADFLEANFEHLLEWEVVSGTDRPRSDALTGAVMVEFGTLAADMMSKIEDKAWVTEFLSTLGDLAGIPFKLIPGGSDREEAERRLRKLAAIEREIGKTDPQSLQDEQTAEVMFALLEEFLGPMSLETAMEAAQRHGDKTGLNGAVPFLYMQDHGSFMDVYKDEYFSDDAQMFSPARKACIAQLYGLHVQAQVAAMNLKTQFLAGLAQKMAPPEQTPQEPTGLAKISESINYKDAPPDIKAQMEMAAGMEPSATHQQPQDNGEGERAAELEGKVAEHQLNEQAEDNKLRRDLIREGHKQESAVAVNEGKEEARARFAPPKPEPNESKTTTK